MGKFLVGTAALAFAFLAALALDFLKAHIIYDVADMFDVPVVSHLSVVQIFGVLFVLSLVVKHQLRETDEEKEADVTERMGIVLSKLFGSAFVYLIIWCGAYIADHIFF
jgi:hypothetical protein